MENLKFLNTQSVAQFKANVQTDEIKVLRNEQTGKCFFSYGSGTGAVISKYPESPLNQSGRVGSSLYGYRGNILSAPQRK